MKETEKRSCGRPKITLSQEQIDFVIKHRANRSKAEIAKALGIDPRTLTTIITENPDIDQQVEKVRCEKLSEYTNALEDIALNKKGDVRHSDQLKALFFILEKFYGFNKEIKISYSEAPTLSDDEMKAELKKSGLAKVLGIETDKLGKVLNKSELK